MTHARVVGVAVRNRCRLSTAQAATTRVALEETTSEHVKTLGTREGSCRDASTKFEIGRHGLAAPQHGRASGDPRLLVRAYTRVESDVSSRMRRGLTEGTMSSSPRERNADAHRRRCGATSSCCGRTDRARGAATLKRPGRASLGCLSTLPRAFSQLSCFLPDGFVTRRKVLSSTSSFQLATFLISTTSPSDVLCACRKARDLTYSHPQMIAPPRDIPIRQH